MQFLKGFIVLASIAAASAPTAQAQTAPPTLEQLRNADAYLKQYEGLQDGSYVFVAYAGDEQDNAPIILPREVFAEMLGNMVVMGDLPPDRVTALTRHVLKQTQEMARGYRPKLPELRARRAQIAAQIREAEGWTPPPPRLRPRVLARNDAPPPSQSGVIARARAAAANSRAANAGSTGASALPWNRTPARAEQPIDGSIAVPLVPVPLFPVPDTAPTPFTDWMTGTFDNDRNVFTLNRGSGSYLYANGTMTADRIDGTVVEGLWTQSSSGQQCADGGYHGRFRITFTEDGFSGLFGYCDEPPGAPGGFQGKRRK